MHRLFLLICKAINKLLLRRHKVNLNGSVQINGILKISNSGIITCGTDLNVNSGGYFNPVGGANRTTLITQRDASIKIGDYCGISNALIYAAESITIEDHVMIGGGCSICDTDFHPLDLEKRKIHDVSAIASKPIVIREGAFIGMHCIILKGVTIGRNSIVGAGSVVTKDIPDGEIWAGNPAKPIKHK